LREKHAAMVEVTNPLTGVVTIDQCLAEDLAYINDYCCKRHNACVACSWTNEKGRILTSERSFGQGEIIFREPPLHIVAEDKENPAFLALKKLCKENAAVFEYEPLWYWTALCSLRPEQLAQGGEARSGLTAVSEDQQRKLLLLYHSQVTEPSDAVTTLIEAFYLEKVEAVEMERLLQVWILNCFEHSDEPLGYSTYFMSSFMSHSCFPNAVWHYEDDDFVLRARRKIEAGDEISVSYLSEDALLESVPARRKHLEDSKHFQCRCDRCCGRTSFAGTARASLDLSRGFQCPACSNGTIFCRVPADLQVSSSVADASPPGERQRHRELHGVACEACRHQVSDADEARLLKEETWLEAKLEEIQRRAENQAYARRTSLIPTLEETLLRVEKELTQHWLADQIRALLTDAYDRNGREEEAEKLMLQRIVFQEGAYPGISGARAWTLEAYADMLLAHNRVTLSPDVKLQDKADATVRRVLQLVPPRYEQSLEILRAMFGEKHEYYFSVHRKAQQLQQELSRLGHRAEEERELAQSLADKAVLATE